MNKLLAFVHRRVLPSVLASLMSVSGLVTALAPMDALAKPGSAKRSEARGRVSADLGDELRAPKAKKARWSKDINGTQFLQLLVTSKSDDAQMTNLRNEVKKLGGVVQVHLAGQLHQRDRLDAPRGDHAFSFGHDAPGREGNGLQPG